MYICVCIYVGDLVGHTEALMVSPVLCTSLVDGILGALHIGN